MIAAIQHQGPRPTAPTTITRPWRSTADDRFPANTRGNSKNLHFYLLYYTLLHFITLYYILLHWITLYPRPPLISLAQSFALRAAPVGPDLFTSQKILAAGARAARERPPLRGDFHCFGAPSGMFDSSLITHHSSLITSFRLAYGMSARRHSILNG